MILCAPTPPVRYTRAMSRTLSILTVPVVLILATTQAHAGALRALAQADDTLWAAGDAGLLLRSDDGGDSWQRVNLPAPARQADFRAIVIDGPSVILLGGVTIPGHPEGLARPVIVRSDDTGKTFALASAPPVGMLYGGAFKDRGGLVLGQASPLCPHGVWKTTDMGRNWSPITTAGLGALRAGAFEGIAIGYAVGDAHRVVSLRRLSQPAHHPPESPNEAPLRAVALAGADRAWAAGSDGSLLRSRPTGRAWQSVPLPIPGGAVRGADLDVIAFADSDTGWVGGGLLGCLYRTGDGGASWEALPAPGPGPVRCLLPLTKDKLLAGGDAGRVWRSTDGGATWKLLRGTEATDVLFIVAPGDLTCWPAIVAHARAGATVAVVFAAQPPTSADTPGDQALHAAVARTGAGGAMVLDNFPSQALQVDAPAMLREKNIQAAWSAELDIPARPELVRQIAAAIRLYRPAVVVTGPKGAGASGPVAEARLIGQVAFEAADTAGDADALEYLSRVHLPAHAPQRVFTGLESNETADSPWREPARPPTGEVTVILDSADYPSGSDWNLEMLAQRAIWQLPWTDLPDRPARLTGYYCRSQKGRLALLTGGLRADRLALADTPARLRLIATSDTLRVANTLGKPLTALPALGKAAQAHPADPLPADRMAMLWERLRRTGKLAEADAARNAFLQAGGDHPLHDRIGMLSLSEWVSSEWQAAAQRDGVPVRRDLTHIRAAAKTFDDWPAWNTTAPGRLLHARALAVTGRRLESGQALKALAEPPYPPAWKKLAVTELSLMVPAGGANWSRPILSAPLVTERGQLDGKLNERFWAARKPVPLVGPDGQTVEDMDATFLPMRTRTHLLVGARLPRVGGGTWTLQIAIDADREAWTQQLLTVQENGQARADLLQRLGPPAELAAKALRAGVRRDGQHVAFELVYPLAMIPADPARGGLWNFQVLATLDRPDGSRVRLTWQPQPDGRLLPHRYGMVRLVGLEGK